MTKRAKKPPSQKEIVEEPADSATAAVPLVGVGASAGGVEALTNLFKAIPANPGAAFLVILHQDPTKASMLTDILASHANIKIR